MNPDAVCGYVPDNHSISPSLQGRDDNAAVFAE
jgi:hypothetical protein